MSSGRYYSVLHLEDYGAYMLPLYYLKSLIFSVPYKEMTISQSDFYISLLTPQMPKCISFNG